VSGRVLWDVDTQVDFMLPQGKLYVPGAEKTAPAMRRLVEAARAAGIRHVASADDHELTDPEISPDPDYSNTFPPHCLRGTPGAERVPETKQEDPLPLSLVPYPPGLVPKLVEEKREILLLKKNFNVFTNPNAEPLLEALDPDEIVLFGVATDICDDAAIRGFLQRGRKVTFVEDAARGLDEDRVSVCTKAWRDAGVAFTSAEEAAASFG
jgi:nicotinamidase/pyrazinamidase